MAPCSVSCEQEKLWGFWRASYYAASRHGRRRQRRPDAPMPVPFPFPVNPAMSTHTNWQGLCFFEEAGRSPTSLPNCLTTRPFPVSQPVCAPPFSPFLAGRNRFGKHWPIDRVPGVPSRFRWRPAAIGIPFLHMEEGLIIRCCWTQCRLRRTAS